MPQLVLEAGEQRGEEIVQLVEASGVEGSGDEAVLDADALVGRGAPAVMAVGGEADRARAFDRIRERLTARLADLDAVEPLGRDTDFPAGALSS